MKKIWPQRTEMIPETLNILHEPLVERDRIILPPLHIKLGLIKQFVKALPHEGECFKYICRVFPQLTTEKLKAGIFDGPQVRQLLKDSNLQKHMDRKQKAAWNAFDEVVKNFLGNEKSQNYENIVKNLVKNIQNPGSKHEH